MKKWQIAISILLVFALGTTAGAFGSRVIFKKRVNKALHTEGTPGIQVIQGMMGRLDLSEPQRSSINAIIAENNKKWETLREEYEPQIKELYETVIEETKKELTDEQRQEIEKMSAKVQRRIPQRNASPLRPESSSPPRSSNSPEASGPPAMSEPFVPKSDPDLIAGIIETLKLEKEKSDAVQSIIEGGLQRQQVLRDSFEKNQATAEEKFQKETEDAQVSIEKKLEKLLTSDQMETYRRMINPEEPRPENFGFDGHGDGFDGHGESMEPKDFNQGEFPIPPDGQQEGAPQGANQDSRPI